MEFLLIVFGAAITGLLGTVALLLWRLSVNRQLLSDALDRVDAFDRTILRRLKVLSNQLNRRETGLADVLRLCHKYLGRFHEITEAVERCQLRTGRVLYEVSGLFRQYGGDEALNDLNGEG